MAIDTNKIKDDAAGILNILRKISPSGMTRSVAEMLQGNQSQIMKAIKQILKLNPTTGGATQAVEFIVDRYKLPESVAARLVANELTDANVPTDSSGSADDFTERGTGPDAGAEDTSMPPKRKIDLSELLKRLPKENRRYDDEGFPDYEGERFPGGPPFNPKPFFPKMEPYRPRFDEEGNEIRPYNVEPYRPKFDEAGNILPEFGTLLADGGRVLKQTGGITETRNLPPEYVEALGKTYAADLTRQAGIPSITTATTQQPGETAEQFAQRQSQAQQFGITRAGMAELAPQVAAQDALQAAAYTQATDPSTGLGAYQPFLTEAQTAATGATALTGPMTTAQTTAYMSPYQQQVIDATLTEFDRQAQIRQNQQAAATLGIPGAFGGGREGVQRAEFDAASDRNRAAIQSNLLQQGFQQAQAARQQDFANQMGLSNLQRGLGASAQDFSRAQISGLGTLGAQQQAQNQAILDAQRQAAQMAVDDPRRRLSMLGQGVAGLSGLGSVQISEAPQAAQASPLTTALGLGLAGADIYGRIFK